MSSVRTVARTSDHSLEETATLRVAYLGGDRPAEWPFWGGRVRQSSVDDGPMCMRVICRLHREADRLAVYTFGSAVQPERGPKERMTVSAPAFTD